MRIYPFVAVIVIALSAACSSVAPDAGFEAVLIQKPILFGHGGVDPAPILPGRSFVAWTTDQVMVDMRPMQSAEDFDDLMSRDGVPLDFHAVVRMRVLNSVQLIQHFGTEWYRSNVQAEFQKLVRDEVKKHGMNETAINAEAADQIDTEVTRNLSAYFATIKLPVELLAVTLGRANPPDAIKNQRIATAEQEQRANTERQRKLAEDQRREAELARAASDNAYRQAIGMTPDQFLQLENIKMQQEVCGGGKCTFIYGGGVVPTLGVR